MADLQSSPREESAAELAERFKLEAAMRKRPKRDNSSAHRVRSRGGPEGA
jgi:hypothetical protein